MQYSKNPIEVLAKTVYSAHLVDAPLVKESVPYHKTPGEPGTRLIERRPAVSECLVIAMFPQKWGSTALGFGGIGGAAITTAYSIAISVPGDIVLVYFGGTLAYSIDMVKASAAQRATFQEDASKRAFRSCSSAKSAYGAQTLYG